MLWDDHPLIELRDGTEDLAHEARLINEALRAVGRDRIIPVAEVRVAE